MRQDKALPWHQQHRRLIIISTIALFTATLFICGIFHSTPEEVAINFALPASYTLGALIPGYFVSKQSAKGYLNSKAALITDSRTKEYS